MTQSHHLTPQVTQNPKIWAKQGMYNCVRLLPYAYGQHINVHKKFVYVYYGCGMQFEVAVSLNHDVMTSFWLHKWPRTQKSEPSRVNNCLRLLWYANGQHINVLKHFVHVFDGCGKQFELAVSLNHDIITSFCLHKFFPEIQNMSLQGRCHWPKNIPRGAMIHPTQWQGPRGVM